MDIEVVSSEEQTLSAKQIKALSVEQALKHFKVDSSKGLSAEEALRRLEVIGARETQVLMSTRHYRSNGLRGFIDTTPIYRSLEVQQIHTYLLQKNGKRAMLDAEKQRDRHLDQVTRHTDEFVRQRLTLH